MSSYSVCVHVCACEKDKKTLSYVLRIIGHNYGENNASWNNFLSHQINTRIKLSQRRTQINIDDDHL